MADLPDILALSRAHKRAVEQADKQALAQQTVAYQSVVDVILDALKRLLADRSDAQATGQDVGLSWFYQRDRLASLLDQARTEFNRWSDGAALIVKKSQRAAARMAQEHTLAAVEAQIPDAAERATVAAAWNRLPTAALTHLVGTLADGTPLAARFARANPDRVEAIRQAIIGGVALGQGAEKIARRVSQAAGMTPGPISEPNLGLYDALRITRTETLRAYCGAAQESYKANDDVIAFWVWVASRSARTCAACLAMDGTEHPIDEPMESHVCCRCVPSPRVRREDGEAEKKPRESTEEWLRRQTADKQDTILGSHAAGEAYRAGKVILGDFLGVKNNATWGKSVYVRSLKSALKNAGVADTRSVGSGANEPPPSEKNNPEIPERPPIPTSIDQAERSIANQKFETAHIWDTDGNYLFGRNGIENKISFTDDEVAMMKNSVFLHNHPRGNTISRQDARMIFEHDIAQMRIATAKGRFVLQRPEGGWPGNAWEEWQRCFRIEGGRHKKDFESGKISEKQLDLRTYRDTMNRFVKELHLDYREEPF